VEELLLDGSYRIFISIKENVVIAGAMVMNLPHFKDFCHLDYFFVNKNLQGKGIGKEFMNDLLTSFKNEGKYKFMTLECYDELIGFYKKFDAFSCNTIKPSQWIGNPKLYNFLIIPITIDGKIAITKELDLILKDIREVHEEELDKSYEDKFVWKTNLINCK